MHHVIDLETLEVRAVQATTSNVGDATMVPELLGQTPADQPIGSVTAVRAQDTRKCYRAITACKAHADMLPRENVKLWKPTTAGAVSRLR